jgi:hypothetical protein
MNTYQTATTTLYPDLINTVSDTNNIDWLDGHTTTALEELAVSTEIVRLVRAEAYALLNQDEMRFDDTVNSTTTWVDAINAIKALYPKP